MCSLKLFVTIYVVLSFHGCALALTTTSSGSGNSNEHTQPPGRTSAQPEEIHNLFSNETRAHLSANGAAVNDKVSVSSINNSVSKTASQDLITTITSTISTTTEGSTSITPTATTSSSIAGTSSNKVDDGPDQHSSTERVTQHAQFPLEGGGTVANIHSSIPERAASKVNITSVQSNDTLSLENMYSDTEQSNKTSTVVARKGAEYKPSKIVPRKGVEPCSPNVTSSENCTVCCGSPNEPNSGEEIDEKNNFSIQGVGNATFTNLNNTTIMQQRTNTSTLISPTEVKKTKATKPLYTLDAVNDNVGNVSAVQTPAKKLEQGSNYVVPVVGTILMVPLIAVLSVFMYKKGCEFWERRHYRRMDFLIDGMYND